MCVHTVQHALPSTQQIVGPDGRELVGMKNPAQLAVIAGVFTECRQNCSTVIRVLLSLALSAPLRPMHPLAGRTT